MEDKADEKRSYRYGRRKRVYCRGSQSSRRWEKEKPNATHQGRSLRKKIAIADIGEK